MTGKDSHELTSREKLRLMKSPVVLGSERGAEMPNLSEFGDRYTDKSIEFARHEEAGTLEVFTDLFFAANYAVFSKTQSVTSHERVASYIGYFCMLWMTWLVVGLYDVRFVTDSIFERVVRAIHLGAFVGFAVVAPKFDPSNQQAATMRAMSLILMASRLGLTIEYGSILWHVRKFKKVHLAFYLQMSIHFVAAMIYLGVTFRFINTHHSSVFVTWYIVGALEALLTFGLSIHYSVLSLSKTHLMNRMFLLSVIILGDSIVVIADKVVIIVDAPDSWDAITIGILTAGVATTYMIFLIYFDWMKASHLPPVRQMIWTMLHFPFHLALVLFLQGFTQFIQWSKVVDVFNHLAANWIVFDPARLSRATSQLVQQNMTDEIASFFKLYPPKYSDTQYVFQEALDNITDIPNSFWPKWADALTDENYELPTDKTTDLFSKIIEALVTAMENSVFTNFEIDLEAEAVKEQREKGEEVNQSAADFSAQIDQATWDRYNLVFTYGYVAAGVCLALMVLLSVVARVTPWKPWHVIRTIIYFLLALGMALTALLNLNSDQLDRYLSTPWLLPTLCIAWGIVLLLTHIRRDTPLFFKDGSPRPLRRGTNQSESNNDSEHAQPMVSNIDGSTSYSGAAGMPYGYQPAPQSQPGHDYV
ncbi:hypothetical protein MKX07_008800 [Trichoderma sp. CBMAI-0711]|uniref:Low temperature requirement A n=1 Tax=Trichoderma parareesei TaxID=858221 RepID=A0A2H2ZXK4_TRIPA|nr:hypothetical protein MKX07_008800 [Trichoderma sp. CBMAI-0711]OTA03934.1 hypothetical protein A9Z42_0044550 [Trichoderma parareesei]